MAVPRLEKIVLNMAGRGGANPKILRGPSRAVRDRGPRFVTNAKNRSRVQTAGGDADGAGSRPGSGCSLPGPSLIIALPACGFRGSDEGFDVGQLHPGDPGPLIFPRSTTRDGQFEVIECHDRDGRRAGLPAPALRQARQPFGAEAPRDASYESARKANHARRGSSAARTRIRPESPSIPDLRPRRACTGNSALPIVPSERLRDHRDLEASVNRECYRPLRSAHRCATR